MQIRLQSVQHGLQAFQHLPFSRCRLARRFELFDSLLERTESLMGHYSKLRDDIPLGLAINSNHYTLPLMAYFIGFKTVSLKIL